MWLLDTTTIKLKYVLSTENLEYAILSHTWEEDEVTFQDIQGDHAQDKKGYQKILWTCQQARSEDIPYAWVDTCCIDKTSSAELSEAINSMYRWYRDAEICYAYLSDALALERPNISTDCDPAARNRRMRSYYYKTLCDCRWFTRGWTLQELLAPTRMAFFGPNWSCIGPKWDMTDVLSLISRIDHQALTHHFRLGQFSVAQRMSWASTRQTTRTEDIAYCLLGIFDINMPLLYGEGKKAFIRLQEEILRTSTDHSILTHGSYTDRAPRLLAPGPEYFAHCGDVVECDIGRRSSPLNLTSQGLHINLPLVQVNQKMLTTAGEYRMKNKDGGTWYAVLNCRQKYNFDGPIVLHLLMMSESGYISSDAFTAHFAIYWGPRTQILPNKFVVNAVRSEIIILRDIFWRSVHGYTFERLFCDLPVLLRIDTRLSILDNWPRRRWPKPDVFDLDCDRRFERRELISDSLDPLGNHDGLYWRWGLALLADNETSDTPTKTRFVIAFQVPSRQQVDRHLRLHVLPLADVKSGVDSEWTQLALADIDGHEALDNPTVQISTDFVIDVKVEKIDRMGQPVFQLSINLRRTEGE